MMVQVLGLLFLLHLTQDIQRALDADTTDISVVKLLTDQLRKIKMEKLQLENEKMVKEQDHRWQGVARVFTLACADEHLLRNLESLVAVQ